MKYRTHTARIRCAASTHQTLGQLAWQVVSATYVNGTATAGSVVKVESLTPASTTAPTTTADIGFKGTPAVPTSVVYLKTAAVAGVLLEVEYVAPGGTAA